MPGYEKLIADYQARGIDSPYASFVLITDSIKTELAALVNVRQQYADPLTAGMVPVDEGLQTLRAQLTAAGIDKVLAEVKRQISSYLAAQGK
jgi:putative aldouronate transport system substrate-binding protein